MAFTNDFHASLRLALFGPAMLVTNYPLDFSAPRRFNGRGMLRLKARRWLERPDTINKSKVLQENRMNRTNNLKLKLLFFLLITIYAPVNLAAAHEWMAPKEAAKVKNTIQFSSESVAKGKELFLDNCAACHGDNRLGKSAKEAGLETSPPNLKKTLGTHSDGGFFWKIQQGKEEMPSFQNDLTDEEVWNIINFIKSDQN